MSDSSFDRLLLDYRLPDMNGVEFLEQLEERLGEPGLPTIVEDAVGQMFQYRVAIGFEQLGPIRRLS